MRKRYPFDQSIQVRLKPSQPGSFETLFEILVQPNSPLITTAVGVVALGAATHAVVELAKYLIHQVTGQSESDLSPPLQILAETRRGDLDALAEAIEPAVVKAHTVINNGAGNIIIFQGDRNSVKLDPRTKAYVSTNIIEKSPSKKR